MGRAEPAAGARFEREISKMLGVKRIIRRHYGEPSADLETSSLVIEAKYRKKLAIETWMQQVEAHKVQGKYCVVLARQHGGKAIAILRATDFLELISGADKGPGEL